MKILLPILSGKETNKEFLKTACKAADEAVLVLVIDQDAMAGEFGFATNEIRRGNDLIEELKGKIRKKRIIVDDVVEWGNTARKIENIIKLKNADKVVLVKQKNDYFKKLVKELKKNVKIPIETIKIEEAEEIQKTDKSPEKTKVSDKKEVSKNKEQSSIERIEELIFGKKKREDN